MRSHLATLRLEMVSYRATFPAKAAGKTFARLAALFLVAVLPLAAFDSADSSIESTVVKRLGTPATAFLTIDEAALFEQGTEEALARAFATMVVAEPEELGPPPPPASLDGPPSIAGLRFWAGGDSTATFMSIKLVERFTGLGASATGTYYQKSTGLSRPDYFDWLAELRGVMRDFEPDITVFMVGANDSQGIKDAEGITRWPFSEEWRALYAGRVGDVMDMLQATDGYVVYVGQPNMGSSDFAAMMAAMNEIIKSEADKRPRVGYIDAWALFSDESGEYQQILPDRDGVPTVFRADDGIHFTWPGGDHLALAVLDEIYRQVIERPLATWWLPPSDLDELLP